MRTTRAMLDALRARAGSDGKAAALLGVSQVTYSRWRSAHTPDLPSDDNALKIAELLSLDPGYVLATVNGDRARSTAARAAWARIAEKFGFDRTPARATTGRNTQCSTGRARDGFAQLVAHTLGIKGPQLAL